jgi:predicted SPOUT superfamily RNA methylase MTH1
VGSAGGKVLFEGVLKRGRTTRFASRTVWIRFGASQNVIVAVNGRAQRITRGTVDVTLGPGRPAA